MKLSQSDAVEIISKLQKGEGTDAQQEEWLDCIKNSFPFYEKIINLLFWSISRTFCFIHSSLNCDLMRTTFSKVPIVTIFFIT